jgi:hypothetical protein
MRTSGARLALGCVSASFISRYLTVINHLFTNTYNRIQCPIPKNSKSSEIKDLRCTQKGAYKPAYKKSEKNGGDQLRDMPAEVAEIVAVWHDLPQYIKAAIKALVQTAM